MTTGEEIPNIRHAEERACSRLEARSPYADRAPLGIYVHWPYCARICPYCDFNVVRDRGRSAKADALVRAIAADLRAQAALTGLADLVSIYFGGGTPSLMPPQHVAELIALIRGLWPAGGEVEVSLEANPTDAEADRFAALAAAGVDRLSLGVQALDDADLAFLKRNHDAAAALRATTIAIDHFAQVSLDLIYALPGRTPQAWTQTLHRVAELGIGHISAYQLTIEPDTPFGRALRRGTLPAPDPDRGAALYDLTVDTLHDLGFDAYEVSNFARGPAARSRHNQVYWRGEAYVGAGPGAHGRLTTPTGRLATEAEAGIDAYIAQVEATGAGWRDAVPMPPREVLEERVMMGLRTHDGVAHADLAALERLAPLATLVAEGWLTAEDGRVRATRPGRLLLDSLTGRLLA